MSTAGIEPVTIWPESPNVLPIFMICKPPGLFCLCYNIDMKNYLKRLGSRKFLITVAGITIFVTVAIPESAYTAIVTLISAYLVSEGAGDAVERYQAKKNPGDTSNPETPTPEAFAATANDDDDIDRDTILPGNH